MMITTAAMTDGGGIAVTVRRSLRTPGRWSVHGPEDRRIGELRPVGGSTTDWWAVGRAGAIQGRAATFGAAVGLVVDAAIDVDTRGRRHGDGCTNDGALDDDARELVRQRRRAERAEVLESLARVGHERVAAVLGILARLGHERAAAAFAASIDEARAQAERTGDEAPGRLPPPRLVRSPGRQRDHRDGDER